MGWWKAQRPGIKWRNGDQGVGADGGRRSLPVPVLSAGMFGGLFGTQHHPVPVLSGTEQPAPQNSALYVNVSDLLAGEDGSIPGQALHTRMLPLNNRVAEYHQVMVSNTGEALLPDSLSPPWRG